MTDDTAVIEQPNYTQIPNALFLLMPLMGEAELRVVMALARQTFGFHRPTDTISISQFQKMTGMSRQGVITGIEAAIKRKIVEEAGTGKRGIKSYRLVIVVDQSTKETSTSPSTRPDKTATSQPSRPPVLKERVLKETPKEKKQDARARVKVPPLPPDWKQQQAVKAAEPAPPPKPPPKPAQTPEEQEAMRLKVAAVINAAADKLNANWSKRT